MAQQVTAYKGYKGRLYPTEKDAEESFVQEGLVEVKERLDSVAASMRRWHGASQAEILMRCRKDVEEFYSLMDRAHGKAR